MKNRNTVLILTTVALSFLLFFLTFPKNQSSAQTKEGASVFSNTTPIVINTASGVTVPIPATNYPANINVSGMTGTVSRVEVSLRGLSHTDLDNLDFLLVGPGGEKFIFLSDASILQQYQPEDGVFRFADDGATTIITNSPFYQGLYKPTNSPLGGNDVFPAPAPAAPYSATTFAQAFNGISPNGTWSLYAVDDSVDSQAGRIESGWELKLTTDGSPQTFANSSYIGIEEAITRATPYSSTINVSGLSGVVNTLKVNLNNVSHTFSNDIDILLVSPNGKSIILMSDIGSSIVSNQNLSFSSTATDFLQSPVVSGTYRPTNSGIPDDFFPFPAPLYPYFDTTSNLKAFNNFNPNGDWQLYVVDDENSNSGMIAGGWSLEITTAPPLPSSAGCSAPSLSPANYPVGANPTNLAVGDFNNDLNRDLVVTNQVSNDISIMINNGLGGFSPQTISTLPVGSNPYAVEVGSFNADSNQDLAVLNSGSNNVSILLGNGDGTFSAPVNFSTGASPISIDIGDFNNDSNQDLAIANFGGFFSGTVSILSGNGNGGFSLPTILRTSTQPAYVKSALLNDDANADLIVANFGANTVSVYFGNGANGFTLSQTISVPNGPVGLDYADVLFNDGIKDLIVAAYNSNTVRVFSGSSGGTFGTVPFNTYNVGANPISVVAADILGNGKLQINAALSGLDKAAVETLNPGVFQLFTVGANPNAIVRSDFNNDGKTDLATANSGANNVTVLTNQCVAASGNIYDFNGNRRTDVGIYRPSNGIWSVNGVLPLLTFGRDRDVIAPADYNGDGKTDLAIYRPESGLWITTNANNPISTAHHYINFGLAEDIPMPADFDGDGKADIAVFRPSNGFWYIRQSSDNSFLAVPFGANGDKPVAADYDGDGKADVAVFRPANATWYILGSQNGFFAQQFGLGSDRTVQGDYDGDGKTDIAVFRNGNWYISRSSDGGFEAHTWGLSGDIPVLGDYDGDGKYDLGIVRKSGGASNWYILRSSDNGIIGFPYGLDTDIPIEAAYSR